jgi:hypothetical protein
MAGLKHGRAGNLFKALFGNLRHSLAGDRHAGWQLLQAAGGDFD